MYQTLKGLKYKRPSEPLFWQLQMTFHPFFSPVYILCYVN